MRWYVGEVWTKREAKSRQRFILEIEWREREREKENKGQHCRQPFPSIRFCGHAAVLFAVRYHDSSKRLVALPKTIALGERN